MFDLSGIEDMKDEDIMEMKINDEFKDCGAITEGSDYGPSVPGGLSEKPTAKPYDETSIPIPSSTTIDADTYNKIIGTLKSSFKEAVNLMDYLENTKVVERTPEQLQEDYMAEAMLQAYEDGPLFEAVDRSDKKEVKAIVRKVRDDVKSSLSAKGFKFYKPNIIARMLLDGKSGKSNKIMIFKSRLWQILGIALVEEGNINEVVSKLNKELAEDLGDYKVLQIQVPKSYMDIFRTKFGWKNVKKSFLLVVDKKIPGELKKCMTGDYKKESADCDDCDDDEKDGKKADSKGKREDKDDDDDEE